ncbi:MAG: DUF2278 family protein [Jatrophihabitantaceae bacterium]
MLADYGVTIGAYDHADSHQGQWLHEIIYLRAGGVLYQCAVDVNEPNGIFQYMVLNSLDEGLFAPIAALTDGYHQLPRNASSGAIDYLRSPLVQQPEGCLAVILTFMNGLFRTNEKVWKDVTGNEAGNALVALVQPSTRVYVFGAPYANPNPYPGMHDIHMNQGDPINSQFHSQDGIWQDGCVVVQTADGKLAGYFGKFATQSLHTDNNGFPI